MQPSRLDQTAGSVATRIRPSVRATDDLGTAANAPATKEEEDHQLALVQLEKMWALGQMASGVAHDLNQYLALISGHGELALRCVKEADLEGGRLQDSLQVIVRAAADGAETVRRLLSFARPFHEVQPERVELAELLRDVAKLTAPSWRDAAQAEGRPIALDVSVKGDAAIVGSPDGLRRAFINLVFNAVDALPRGGAISLSAQQRDDRVDVEVTDSGIGMSAEIQARVFEPFFSTKGARGSGLGLPVVAGIVAQHGGQLSLRSQPSQGTTVLLSFPAAPSTVRTDSRTGAETAISPLRILAVDDEPAMVKMIAAMLAPDGHDVVVATSAAEALNRLEEAGFDLVITDLGMGAGMNGWELTDQIRGRFPSVRIVLVTGWAAQIDPDHARARGVEAILAKPYHLAELRRVIAQR